MSIDLKSVDVSAEFLLDIEYIVTSKGVSYFEAVCLWCHERNLEPEYAGSLVKKNRALKAKVREEAERLNYLKKD